MNQPSKLKRIYDPLRYFYSRDSKSGEYWVKDRQLHDMIIAKCFYREAAALVQTALNESLKPKETQLVKPSPNPEHVTSRPAVLGDLIYHPLHNLPDGFWVAGFGSLLRAFPPPRS